MTRHVLILGGVPPAQLEAGANCHATTLASNPELKFL